MEADRALKASSALTAKTSVSSMLPKVPTHLIWLDCQELQNTLMRLSNLESMLETSSQKAKQDEKEIRQLQYGERLTWLNDAVLLFLLHSSLFQSLTQGHNRVFPTHE